MIDKLAQDIYSAAIVKLAAISSTVEKSAASNLRSDLVLGRLSDAAKNTLMSTPRYSRSNPGQILADIKSSLRGRGNDVGALTQELKNRGIPYKVRGKGLSPKDIELDLSGAHDILNTTYLPSNYSESFANHNVHNRLYKALDNARNAGYSDINVSTDYGNPSVFHNSYNAPNKKSTSIGVRIPAKVSKTYLKHPSVTYENTSAGAILHETNELNQAIQQSQNYDKAIKNIEQGPNLYTAGEYPGVIKPTKRSRYQYNVKPLDMYSASDNMSPYNYDGGNNHTSATILMNELMDQHALHVGRKPEAVNFDNILSYRMGGTNNPVNRMTGIDLTSSEQPFVPRNIAKNKKEYLKRIRTVNKAENALQQEHLRKMKQFEEGMGQDSPLYEMLDNQLEATARRELDDEFFKAFPQGTKKFNNISDFDRFIQENPLAEQYIKENERSILRQRKKLPTNVDEELSRLSKMDLDSNEEAWEAWADMDHGARRLLDNLNYFMKNSRNDKVHSYIENNPELSAYFSNAMDHIDKIRSRQGHRMVGDSQQNIDFLVNYLRNKGFTV